MLPIAHLPYQMCFLDLCYHIHLIHPPTVHKLEVQVPNMTYKTGMNGSEQGAELTIAGADCNHRALGELIRALDVKYQLDLIHKCLLNGQMFIIAVCWTVRYRAIVSMLRPDLQGSMRICYIRVKAIVDFTVSAGHTSVNRYGAGAALAACVSCCLPRFRAHLEVLHAHVLQQSCCT